MKIKLYLMSYRARHGDSGIDYYYDEKSRIQGLAAWLDNGEDDEALAEVKTLIEAGELGEAEEKLSEISESSGHEWEFEEAEIDVIKAEIVTPHASIVSFAAYFAARDALEAYEKANPKDYGTRKLKNLMNAVELAELEARRALSTEDHA